MKLGPLAILILGLSTALQAQDDARIITVAVGSSGFAHVATSPDVRQVLFFRQGEQIESVTLSDPAAYSVEVAGSRDTMTIQALRPGGAIILSVRTNARAYEIQLAAQPASSVPSIIRLTDTPSRPTQAMAAAGHSPGDRYSYRLSGSKALWPDAISDDGERTYLEWSGDRPLPATFAIGPGGTEQMVDGYMRAGIFTVDRVFSELIFRVDRQTARARRKVAKNRD